MTRPTCLAAALLAALAVDAGAAGFALIEQNASGLGNAYAGAAAVAQDASTIYFNPAGMVHLPDRQLVLAGHLIKPTMEFSGTAVITPPSPAAGTPVSGGMGGDAGDWALVPNFYYAFRLSPAVHLGLGINAPFGLNLQRIEAELTNRQPLGLLPAAPDTLVKIKGDDYSWGYNLGLLWQVSPATRIGLSYRSEVEHTLKGKASSNPNVLGGPVKAGITLPDSASLSFFHRLSPRWDLLADVTWTGWSDFDRLAIVGAVNKTTPENWDDILRYSLGATWHMNGKLSLRGGVAHDEAVVSDRFRTPRIPDGARTWLAIGGQYRLSRQSALDFGYAHLFVNDPKLDIVDNQTRLSGTYNAAVDILSVQYTHGF